MVRWSNAPSKNDACASPERAVFGERYVFAVVFRVLPESAGKSIVRTTWLVHPDAQEGVDYDVDSLTAVWRATNNEDRELVIGTQNGVTNPGYVPGPYSMVEDDVEAFVNWYVKRVEDYLAS